MSKLKLALLYGGKSAEHQVSVSSAKAVYSYLDKKKYIVFPIYISKKGSWFWQSNKIDTEKNIAVTPCFGKNFNIISTGDKKICQKIDVFFPILHGPFGEDGTMQGLLEVLNVAYVGSPVLASAMSIDKTISKKIVESLGIDVLESIALDKNKKINFEKLKLAVKKMGYPVFVKPNCLGSSVGVSKVKNKNTLKSAVLKALKYDSSVIIEKSLENPREIICGVLGDGSKTGVSTCGEVIMLTREFYDYESKYLDCKSHKVQIPAKLSKKVCDDIRKKSVEIFKALKCSGFARVDFFFDDKTQKIYFCEINTIPGFTKESLYPLLWEKTAIKPAKVLDKLIQIALKEYSLKKSYLRR